VIQLALAALLIALLIALHPLSAQEPQFAIAIRDHQFYPSELHVPAGKKIKLVVKNEDATSEEFESYALNVEKRIKGHSSGTVWVGPLKPGRYEFIGEDHEKSADGVLIAE
jgi:heme/copper-type cytochrome/quinol oxidase subunit 2